jgi:ankyrin repeat protein
MFEKTYNVLIFKILNRERIYIKNLVIKVVIVVFVLLVYGFYNHYSFNKPDILFESALTKADISEEFEFSVKQKGYVVGLAVNQKSFTWDKRVDGKLIVIDGNYTIEYYIDDKLDRKEVITGKSISKLYKDLWHISGTSSASTWSQMTLGQLKQPGNYKIKVTVHKPDSSLKNFQGKLYFFANKSNEKLMQEFNSYNTPELKAKNRRERLLKNLIDANETNQTLIPLRKALNENDFKIVKKIIEADNNITVNTKMFLHRKALDYAAFENNVEITKYLIDNGADIHHKDELGKNALAYAIENNATKTAKLLLSSGIDVNEVMFVQNYLSDRIDKRFKGRLMSALQYTAGNALFEMTELLLKNGMQDNILVSEATNINVYTYIYSYTNMNVEEKEKIQKLFDKYEVNVENLNKQKPLFKN